jgi:L,D-transpeptidase ErfK/SrfK
MTGNNFDLVSASGLMRFSIFAIAVCLSLGYAAGCAQSVAAVPNLADIGKEPDAPFVAVYDVTDDLVGSTKLHIIQGKETLIDVARQYDVGFDELKAANPGIDTFIPGEGRTIVVPGSHLLPASKHRGIVINLSEMRLYYFSHNGKRVATFPIGIGRDGLETPTGTAKIMRKRKHPIWYPTKTSHEENPDLPNAVAPGPDNPLGDYALYLSWAQYLIHGTNKPPGVGRRVSHGCIRMYPEDIERLFHWTKVGTPVTVVSQEVKLGWHAGALYLEVTPSLKQIDELEETGKYGPDDVKNIREIVLAVAGQDAAHIDWHAVIQASRIRDGVPVRITE